MSVNWLYRSINSAREFTVKTRQALLGLTELFGEEKVEEWRKLNTEPKLVKGEWTSVYRVPKSKGECRTLD